MNQMYDIAKAGSSATKRGTIIIDSSMLANLCADIPNKEHPAEEPRKFLEILPFLARNGYDIIIPEMSSYEVGKIVANGDDIGKAYIHDKQQIISDTIKPFLQKAARGRLQNIRIDAECGNPIVDEHCYELRKLAAEHSLMQAAKSNDIVMRAGYTTRRGLNILNDGKDHDLNYGDEAVIATVKKVMQSEGDKPIFVFSDKIKIHEIVEDTHRPELVAHITTNKLIHALVYAGLKEDVGFPSKMGAKELEQNRKDYFTNNGMGEGRANFHVNESDYRNKILVEEFTKQMKQLASDLHSTTSKVRQSGESHGRLSSHQSGDGWQRN